MSPGRRSVEQPLLDTAQHEEYSAPRRGSNSSLASFNETAPQRFSLADMVASRRDKMALVAVAVGLTLFLGGTVLLIATSHPTKLGYFAPHAPLNALAITALVLGICTVQPPTPPAAQREARLDAHRTALGGMAVPLMLLGTSFMYYNKSRNGAEHITSWHAVCGSTVVLWMLAQAAVGILSVYQGGAVFGGGAKAKAVYKYHRVSGYALAFLALTTAFLGGMFSTWAVGRGPSYVPLRVAAYGVGIPLIAIGLVLRVRPSKMRFTQARPHHS